jgi:S1-C subfamily serine protease
MILRRSILSPTLALVMAAALPAVAGEAVNPRQAMRAELQALAQRETLSRAFNLVHELTAPSVVSIHINEQRVAIDRRTGKLGTRQVEVGEGSGFIVHVDKQYAYILTNAHVVMQTDAQQEFVRDRSGALVWNANIQVQSHDKRVFEATPVGQDVQSDLAMVRIATTELPAIVWGDSEAMHVGDWVVALGYPFGVGYSASTGIVSATSRSTGIYGSEAGFESFIQSDAAINPGNSGGPMLNLRGEVVGVNSNILSRSGASAGLGFAIPSRLARRVAEDLIEVGRVRRPFLGVQLAGLMPQEADRLGIPNREGVRITQVVPDSPADKAGLQADDVIIAVAGQPTQGLQDFRADVAAARIGQPLAVRVWRGKSAVEAAPVLVSLDSVLEAEQAAAEQSVTLNRYGLRLGADGKRGLVVEEVAPDSPAAKAGIRRGHRLLRIGGIGAVDALDQVRGADALPEIVAEIYRDGRIVLVRLRGG